MSYPFVCTSCRLRLLQKCAKTSVRQQRWLSHTSPLTQDQKRANRDHFRGREAQPRRQRDGYSGPEARGIDGEGVRGRYSGQVLRPEKLLQQLDEPHQVRKYDHRQQQSARTRAQRDGPPRTGDVHLNDTTRENTFESSRMTPLVWKLRGLFLRSRSGEANPDREIWTTLKDVLDSPVECDTLKELVQDSYFRRAYFFWTMRVTGRWLEALGASDTPLSGTTHTIPIPDTYPSPSQALKIWCYLMKTSGGAIWPRVLWRMASGVAEIYVADEKKAHTLSEATHTALRELMRTWALCMSNEAQHRQQKADLEVSDAVSISSEDLLATPPLDWRSLPEPLAFAESLQYQAHNKQRRTSFAEALSMLVNPGMKPARNLETGASEDRDLFDYESAALVTLDTLQVVEESRGGAHALEDFESWKQLLEVTLKNVRAPGIPAALAQRMAQLAEGDTLRQYYDAMVKRQNLLVEQVQSDAATQATEAQDARPMTGVDSSPPNQKKSSEGSSESTEFAKRFATLSIKRLERALEEQDLRAVERVRKDMVDFVSRHPGTQPPQALYEHLIYAFLCLRSLPVGIEIWNQMVKAGYQPRMETFTVMIKGSQHLRDLDSMEYFWNKMRQAGVQPDGKAWSTRIYGLMRKGHTDAGLKALAEMSHEWFTAAKAEYAKDYPASNKKKAALGISPTDVVMRFEGDIRGVPRPDVVIMNSAISPLAGGKDRLIPKILAWGRPFGIEPDLSTYNALLNVSMRRGMVDEASNIFRRMKERHIEADSTTWTVLLTAMFEGGFIDDLEPQQQQERVLEYISSLEAMGDAAIDEKGYALIMDRLLKTYNNPQAAQAILAHMSSRGVEPNVHMYTILMASYFEQSPPNFAAAEGLWAHIQSSKGGYGAALDRVFYDRMIESYATHHASVGTAPMLSFLAKMEAEGKKSSWRAMEHIARTLAETGEWTRLAQIVDKTRRRLQEEKGGDTRYGQRDFWRFVISTGMLRHEGITSPEQIMGGLKEDPLGRVQSAQRGIVG